MLFFEGVFFIFLGVVLTLFACFRNVTVRKLILLVGSYLFYASWNPWYAVLILASTMVDYVAALQMGGQWRRRWLLASLAANLGSLFVFKYLDFAISSYNWLAGVDIPLVGLLLPVGISFFTFQSLSYTIDVYRRELEPRASFVDVALFIVFFPQLVAGPIVRARDFFRELPIALPQFRPAWSRVTSLFCVGLFKKVVLADQLALVADPVFMNPQQFDFGGRLYGVLGFAGQIYCDFSGYTDMALALALLFGFHFPPNFRSPYLARSPQEFWRRWHISLSTWLRDYLYIPLGGSRHGPARTAAALLTTMLLGGLWHGAAWTFVLWGLFHGALLCAARFAPRPLRSRTGVTGRLLWDLITWVAFFALTLVGWTIFRADGVDTLLAFVDTPALGNVSTMTVMGTTCLVAVMVEQLLREASERTGWQPGPRLRCFIAGTLLAGALVLRPPEQAPFIYFQF